MDGRFRIVRRFGDSSTTSKQVYLVERISERSSNRYVLKLFTPDEEASFYKEVNSNKQIYGESRFAVLMLEYVEYR